MAIAEILDELDILLIPRKKQSKELVRGLKMIVGAVLRSIDDKDGFHLKVPKP